MRNKDDVKGLKHLRDQKTKMKEALKNHFMNDVTIFVYNEFERYEENKYSKDFE